MFARMAFPILLSAVLLLTSCTPKPKEKNPAMTSDSAPVQTPSSEESTAAPETGAPETPSPTVFADFSKTNSAFFFASDGWSNGNEFGCAWVGSQAVLGDGKLTLTLDRRADGSYISGEFRTHRFYGYGLYEVSMKPIKNDGVVSSFFTYTGPHENGNPWDEIDIEFLGKDTTKIQFNYFTNGVGNHVYLYDLGFDASKEFHTYGFRWTEDAITWYVDGKAVYTATADIPTTPGRIMMNVWNGVNVDGWLNPYDGTVPLTAEYQWVKYYKEG